MTETDMTETDTPTSYDVPVSDPRHALFTAFDAALPVLAAAEQADQSLPTPCDDFTVGDLLAHLNSVARRITGMAQGRPASEVPDSTVEPDGRYALAWTRHRDEVVATWAGLPDDAELVAPWRPLSRDDAAGIYAAEVLVHSWDLAVAVGAPFTVSDAVAEVGIAAVGTELPPEARAGIYAQIKEQLPPDFPWEDPYGAAVAVPAEASAIDRLVAISGRSPRWPA